MTNSSAVVVLDRFYAAEAEYVAAGGRGKADFAPVAAVLDPDVLLTVQPGLPYSGSWRGHAGLEEFQAIFSQTWSSIEFLETSQIVDGDQVAARLRVRFTARATGRELETSLVQLNSVRAGLVTEFRTFYWDPAAVSGLFD
jgi:ketosteroid isomerase-like protein